MITSFNIFENLNNHDNILVICDVQKEFDEFIPNGMVDELFNYCNEFKDVYQIWDSNKASKPSWKFPNQKIKIEKKYGTKFSDDLVNATAQLDDNTPEGHIIKSKINNTYIVKVNNNHGWFFITQEMAELFEKLKNKKVILVGGADNECLYDCYISMKSFGIKPTYNHKYIYSAETKK